MNNKKDDAINSHIQMPKLLLKRFHNEYNFFYYYNVKNNFIGNHGTAESMNTEIGYYSKETEMYLQKEVETPFSKILEYLEDIELANKQTISVYSTINETILSFMYALIARAPSFHKMMNDDNIWLHNLSIEEKRDHIIKSGINIAKENNVFAEYIPTFLINNTDIPFVLSMNGIYNYTFNGHPIINLPISPTIAISLIHKNYTNRVIYNDGAIAMFETKIPELIMHMNQQAFSFQAKHQWGYVICPEREELDRLSKLI